VDGLPLLADEDPASANGVAAPEPPTTVQPSRPAGPRPGSRKNNQREMERIMTLAEENRPELVSPD
jgi:hypothetical protein